jgi:hypothetical protein
MCKLVSAPHRGERMSGPELRSAATQ